MIVRIQFIWSKYHYLIHNIQNLNNMYHLASIHNRSIYNHTKHFFVNSYPWLFPGGIGDIYNLEQGEIPIKERRQHLLQYYDGRLLEDSIFGLFLYNIIQRHTNDSEGNFFFRSDCFIGRNLPTIQELKKTASAKKTLYTNATALFKEYKRK
jgi:hypothetical protein